MGMFLTTIAIILSLFSAFFVNSAHAQDVDVLSTEPSSTPSASVGNSFELFWPLTAGKTETDSFYSLKLIKEQVGGWFINGDSKKADYAVLLGTKRVLEAEKLIKDGKIDLALETLKRAEAQFSSAYNYIKHADSKGKLATREIRRDRLINVKLFIDYLKTVAPEKTHPALDTVKEKADVILKDYLVRVNYSPPTAIVEK